MKLKSFQFDEVCCVLLLVALYVYILLPIECLSGLEYLGVCVIKPFSPGDTRKPLSRHCAKLSFFLQPQKEKKKKEKKKKKKNTHTHTPTPGPS